MGEGKMNDRRNGVYIKLITWIFAEIILNLVGLDNLADYSEYIFDSQAFAAGNQSAIFTTRILDSKLNSQINSQPTENSTISALFASLL
jgi:hypothetical protein